jgi:hypothetical protein
MSTCTTACDLLTYQAYIDIYIALDSSIIYASLKIVHFDHIISQYKTVNDQTPF